MLNNTKYLHLLLEKNDLEVLESINVHLLKKKYPGEHVALIKEELRDSISGLDLFHEIKLLDVKFLQRSSFSPILGDATGFNIFYQVIKPLTQTNWAKVFNYNSGTTNNAITALFTKTTFIGPHHIENQLLCNESPLKLKQIMESWGTDNTAISSWLLKRSLAQLDLAEIEKTVGIVTELKSNRAQNDLKTILVGVNLTELSTRSYESIRFASETFSLVSLNTQTANLLTAEGFQFIDWSEKDTSLEIFLDLNLTTGPNKIGFWDRNIDISNIDNNELADIFADTLAKNFSKWSSLAFLFDYLGNAKLALNCEKIITKYDKGFLKPYLHQEVMLLKSFAKILIDGIRKQGTKSQDTLIDFWITNPSTLSIVSAIELSLQPSMIPLFRNDSDLIALKTRMRNLNSYFERLHRACTIELPKTDLALTL